MKTNQQIIAFATCPKLPNPADDDELLAEYLRAKGFEVVYAFWNDTQVKWEDFVLVLIRSTWDYHLHMEAWYAWLQSLEEKRVNIWNPVKTLQWNTHKFYLKELHEKGIPIVPTVFIPKGKSTNLQQILTSNGWNRGVVKPAVSLGADDTWQTSLATAAQQQTDLEALVSRKDVLVQAFMPEIQSQGEHSLMFFGGKFSHAVVKSNPTGDFRIQEEHGGVNQPIEIHSSVIQQAEKILESIDYSCFYARVDVILRENQLILMELELIEPSLFFDLGEEAVEQFGELILTYC